MMISPQEAAARTDRVEVKLWGEDITLILALLSLIKDGKPCPEHDWCGGTSLIQDEAYSGHICHACADAFVMESNGRYLYERLTKEWNRR